MTELLTRNTPQVATADSSVVVADAMDLMRSADQSWIAVSVDGRVSGFATAKNLGAEQMKSIQTLGNCARSVRGTIHWL